MQTSRFLDYLHEHEASRALAEDLSALLTMRRRHDLEPVSAGIAESRRIAS